MAEAVCDAQPPKTLAREAESGVDSYLAKHFPFRPGIRQFELKIRGWEDGVLTVGNEPGKAKRSSVILALEHSLEKMRDRHNGHEGCWSLNRILLREFSEGELLSFLSEPESDKFLVMTALLFKELKTELEELLGRDRVADIEHWGCLQIRTIE